MFAADWALAAIGRKLPAAVASKPRAEDSRNLRLVVSVAICQYPRQTRSWMDASPQQKDHCYSGSAPNQAVNQSALWFIPPRRVKRHYVWLCNGRDARTDAASDRARPSAWATARAGPSRRRG